MLPGCLRRRFQHPQIGFAIQEMIVTMVNACKRNEGAVS